MNYNNIKFEAAYGTFKQIPLSDLPEIAFSGRSNVGKSSTINKLFNRKHLARVSAVPGKTITVNFYKFENIRMVDLPGYGYAKGSKSEKERWRALVEGYFGDNRNLKLVFQLLDSRHDPTADDVMMLEYLLHNKIPFAVVLTKVDKLSKTAQNELAEVFRTKTGLDKSVEIIRFSAKTGDGVEEVKNIIEKIGG